MININPVVLAWTIIALVSLLVLLPLVGEAMADLRAQHRAATRGELSELSDEIVHAMFVQANQNLRNAIFGALVVIIFFIAGCVSIFFTVPNPNRAPTLAGMTIGITFIIAEIVLAIAGFWNFIDRAHPFDKEIKAEHAEQKQDA